MNLLSLKSNITCSLFSGIYLFKMHFNNHALKVFFTFKCVHQYDKYLFIRYQYMQDTGIFELQERVSLCIQIFQIACKYRYTSLHVYAQSDLMPSTSKNNISSNFCERHKYITKMIAHFCKCL